MSIKGKKIVARARKLKGNRKIMYDEKLFYNFMHDFKSPLTNVMGFSKLLLKTDIEKLTKEQKTYLKIISDESNRTLDLFGKFMRAGSPERK